MTVHEFDVSNQLIAFKRTDPTTLQITDTVGREQLTVHFDEETTIDPGSDDCFLYPVDESIAITTDEITVDDGVTVFVRDHNGHLIESPESESDSLDSGRYVIELGYRFKVYFAFDSAFDIHAMPEHTHFQFPRNVTVHIGARSNHDQPAHTIQVSEDPRDLMAAISTFGNAIKTTTPERTFPTLRGHPPRLMVSDSLEIPSALNPPESGITVELPPTLGNVLSVAPLAFYLDATVIPGDDARITTTDGWEYPLDQEDLYLTIQRVLKQVFLFDCATRTEGLYPVQLRERNQIEAQHTFDFEHLYTSSIAERLQAYLEIDFNSIANIVPQWPAHTVVQDRCQSIEVLPHLVNKLSTITPVSEHSTSSPDGSSNAVDRTHETDGVDTPVSESIWFGDGFKSGSTKALLRGYENRLALSESTGDISVTVVVNDDEFVPEASQVTDFYGSASRFDFEVTVHQNLNTDTLAELLTHDSDFLHYIGHVTDDGIQCVDGYLDVGALDTVGVTYFLLNACNSAQQGIALVNAGSVGGIVTLAEVVDSSAIWFGVNLGKLLNAGYPLHAAKTILEPVSLVSDTYQVVGAGTATVSPHKSIPLVLDIDLNSSPFEVQYTTFHSDVVGVGTMARLNINEDEEYLIVPNSVTRYAVAEELLEIFSQETCPVFLDEELFWSQDIDSFPPQ